MTQGLVEETEAAMRRLDKLHPAFSLVATGLSEAMKTRRRFTAQYEQMRCDFDATGTFMGESSTARSPIADTTMLAEWASWCAMDCEERLHQLTAVTDTYRSHMNPGVLDMNEQEATFFLLFLGEMATLWAAYVVDERFGVLAEIEDCTDVAKAQELYRAHGIRPLERTDTPSPAPHRLETEASEKGRRPRSWSQPHVWVPHVLRLL